MPELLIFIAKYFAYIFKPPGYRIVDSEVAESFGNALLVLESDQLRVRFGRVAERFARGESGRGVILRTTLAEQAHRVVPGPKALGESEALLRGVVFGARREPR